MAKRSAEEKSGIKGGRVLWFPKPEKREAGQKPSFLHIDEGKNGWEVTFNVKRKSDMVKSLLQAMAVFISQNIDETDDQPPQADS